MRLTGMFPGGTKVQAATRLAMSDDPKKRRRGMLLLSRLANELATEGPASPTTPTRRGT